MILVLSHSSFMLLTIQMYFLCQCEFVCYFNTTRPPNHSIFSPLKCHLVLFVSPAKINDVYTDV